MHGSFSDFWAKLRKPPVSFISGTSNFTGYQSGYQRLTTLFFGKYQRQFKYFCLQVTDLCHINFLKKRLTYHIVAC